MANCPLCGSGNKGIILKTKDKDPRGLKSNKTFHLVKCMDCSLHFIDNLPKKEDIAKHYGSDYYAQKTFGNKLMNKIVMLSRLSKIKAKKSSLLDYGCGNGDFLLKMKQEGWNVNGVEFSDAGIKISEKKLGIKIIDEKKFNRLNDKFDIITLWHVLEHIEKPNETLKKLHKILDKNGLLVISVPNMDAMQFHLFKKNTFHLDIPRHSIHYSPKSISNLLNKNGFGVIGFNHYSLEYNPFGFMQSFLNSIGCEFNFLYNLIKRGYRRRVGMFKFFYSFFATFILLPFLIPIAVPIAYIESFLGRGASFVVYAKKR